MARLQVEDGGDGLHMCRVSMNVLNKQSQTAGKWWSFICVMDVGLTTPHREKRRLLTNVVWTGLFWLRIGTSGGLL
jgi:hypothetical protein